VSLGTDGMPKKAHGWEDTFGDANARVAEAWVAATFPGLEGQAREDRKAQCPLWCRPHMARHSFALKWFSILSVAWDSRVKGFTAAELADLRDQLGDIWYQMAGLLGHAHPQTARDVYLEPFTGLQVDYLMALLDEDEAVAVNALVRPLPPTAPASWPRSRLAPPGEGLRRPAGRPAGAGLDAAGGDRGRRDRGAVHRGAGRRGEDIRLRRDAGEARGEGMAGPRVRAPHQPASGRPADQVGGPGSLDPGQVRRRPGRRPGGPRRRRGHRTAP
jgi:hypothetical protein